MWTPKDIPKKLNPTGEIGVFDRSGYELVSKAVTRGLFDRGASDHFHC